MSKRITSVLRLVTAAPAIPMERNHVPTNDKPAR
jgi:hypothetical protein